MLMWRMGARLLGPRLKGTQTSLKDGLVWG